MAKIIGSHIPAELKNLAINGALDFWQRVGSSTTTVNSSSIQATITADMFKFDSGGSTNKNYSVVRSTDVPSQAQSGFVSTYSYLFTMLTGIASPAAGDYVVPIDYRMEGLDYEKIHAKVATFGFWFKSSIAGTYSFALQNGSQNRSYVTTFSQSGANTWQYQTITVQMDSSGTWNFDNTIGLIVLIGAVAGSTSSTSSLNQWQSGSFLAASSGTNWQATTNATVQIAQFSIVEGPLGLGATGFQRQGKSIAQESALCLRYFESVPWTGTPYSSTRMFTTYGFKVPKRNTSWTLTWSSGDTTVSAADGNANQVNVGAFSMGSAVIGPTTNGGAPIISSDGTHNFPTAGTLDCYGWALIENGL